MKSFSCVRIDLEVTDNLLHRVFTQEGMREYLEGLIDMYSDREYFPSPSEAQIAICSFLATINASDAGAENDMQLGPIVIHCITC